MSPEQCQGLPLDQQSDIYSTGVMMYEALTGEPPLLGENIVDTMQMHVTTQPLPFSQIRPDLYIPPAVEAIVRKALEKEPTDRFHSMLEFREALEYIDKNLDAMAGEPVGISRPGARSPRSTRQGMTGSRAPSQMPKPILDTPDLRLSSSGNPKYEGHRPSAMPIPDRRTASSTRAPKLESKPLRNSGSDTAKKKDSDGSLASFKVDELEEFEDSNKVRRIVILSAAGVILLIALVLVVLLVLRHQ
jgi:serine/threonine protein kinase